MSVAVRELEAREPEKLHTARVLIACAVVILLEGFDLGTAGVSAPRLAPLFHLDPAQLGRFLGASAVGVFLGAIVGGVVADRTSRRPVLVAGVLLFGLASLSTALATSLPGLMAARLVTGLGLGAAMPVAIALASDHSPPAMKKRAVGFIYCTIPLGGALSGLVMSTPAFGQGWRSVYVIGGIAPLVLAPLLAVLLPGTASPSRRDPRARGGRGFQTLTGLLGGEQAMATVPLWLATFGTLLVTYLLLGWMPTLLGGMGLSKQEALYGQMIWNLGASIGAAAGGYLLDRKLLYSTPAAAYAVLAILLAVYGFASLHLGTALLVAFGVGAAAVLAQGVLYALTPLCYPAEVRNTGVGAAVAAGRLGTIAGPLMAGSLLNGGKTPAEVLVALIPITAGAGIMALLVVRRIAKNAT
jgi:AAHS family 3-hydroxyphenylpropionic acid transporter